VGILGGIAGIFTAVSGIFQGWFQHKIAATQAARDTEITQIQAGVQIQQGSWKDEYLVIFWSMPLWPAIADSVIHWDPQMKVFLGVVNNLPVWYTTILIGMTTASFGVKTFKEWKSSVLDREMKWDTHEKNGGNGKKKGLEPPVEDTDPYAAVRPTPPGNGG